MKKLVIAIVLFGACIQSPDVSTLGGLSYTRYNDICKEDSTLFWLLDVRVSNTRDSILFSTFNNRSKLELRRQSVDPTSSLVKLLTKTCVNDSVFLKLPADSFYSALGGKCPESINCSMNLEALLWIRDKLDNKGYVAHKLAYENESINQYIKTSKWQATLDSASHIRYEFLNRNLEGHPLSKRGKLNYSISKLNGLVLTKNKDSDPLIYDVNDTSILKGIQRICSLCNEGDRVRAILPSSQAFGKDGNSKVNGFTPLVIELEIIEVTD